MAKRKEQVSKVTERRPTNKWRSFLSALLVGLGCIALVASIVTRYANHNLLDANRYAEIVGPLPQDPAVAAALGTYTADKIFANQNVQQQLTAVLPPKLAPAAPLLTNTLKEQIQRVAQSIAASNAFTTAWTEANRRAQQALLKVAHSEPKSGEQRAQLQLKLTKLYDKVQQKLGGQPSGGMLLSTEQRQRAATLKTNLHESVQQLRSTVSAVETGAWLFPLLALLLLAGAIFAANSRQKTILGIGITLIALGATMLLTFWLASQRLLATISQSVYRNAAQVVYDAFYSNLQARIIGLIVLGGVVVLVALLFGPYGWALRLRKTLHMQR